MYKRLMMLKTIPAFVLVFLLGFSVPARSDLIIPVRDSSVLEISRSLWFNEFDNAVILCDSLISNEPENPLGYFLKGTVLQSICEEFRTDIFNKEIDSLLSVAIDMADDLKKKHSDNPDWLFIAGASYGYRALHRSFHGRWFKAFRDGLKCSSRLKKALELDSTYHDAYLGLGAYNYYKSVMADDFFWLPFVSDRREEGMEQISMAANFGFLATFNARESFLRIYLMEKEYDDLVNLADSLNNFSPDDPLCLLYQVYGLARTGNIDRAIERLNLLKKKWKESQYFDQYGFFEAELAMAVIFYMDDDSESAMKIIDQILSNKDYRDANPYYEETYNRAKELRDEIK